MQLESEASSSFRFGYVVEEMSKESESKVVDKKVQQRIEVDPSERDGAQLIHNDVLSLKKDPKNNSSSNIKNGKVKFVE